jgi:hypothetical protein
MTLQQQLRGHARAVFVPIVRARLAQSISNSAKTCCLDPSNVEYLSVHAGPARGLIRALHGVSLDEASARLHGALGVRDTSRGGLVEALLRHRDAFCSVLGVPTRGAAPPIVPLDAASTLCAAAPRSRGCMWCHAGAPFLVHA